MAPASKIKSLRCPTCQTIVLQSGEDFPFCSDRCRRIDLGKWASGVYKISSPILDPEVLEGLDDSVSRPRPEAQSRNDHDLRPSSEDDY